MDTYRMTRENTRRLATGLIDGLMACHDKGEWISVTMNLTAGPTEGPVLNMSFLPGTTKDNAVRIQNEFINKGREVNDG